MQVLKVKAAVESARIFAKRAEEIIAQAENAKFLLCDGKHAKILKKLSTKVMMAMTEMRRP